jgi:ABC-type uncharacterized transport system fused permease/ATPase subunit
MPSPTEDVLVCHLPSVTDALAEFWLEKHRNYVLESEASIRTNPDQFAFDATKFCGWERINSDIYIHPCRTNPISRLVKNTEATRLSLGTIVSRL